MLLGNKEKEVLTLYRKEVKVYDVHTNLRNSATEGKQKCLRKKVTILCLFKFTTYLFLKFD